MTAQRANRHAIGRHDAAAHAHDMRKLDALILNLLSSKTYQVPTRCHVDYS